MTQFTGLSEREAALSREKYGSNAIPESEPTTFWAEFKATFQDPMIRILLAVALLMVVMCLFGYADVYEPAGTILAVILVAIVSAKTGVASDTKYRQLKGSAKKDRCKVYRDGIITILDVDQVVVGDKVLLQAGDKIPADGVLISGGVRVDNSALNGEAEECPKTAAPEGTRLPQDITGDVFVDGSSLFRGAVLFDGEGVLDVQQVGVSTMMGRMAQEMQADEPDSPLKVKLARLAGLISKFGYIGAVVIATMYLGHSVLVAGGFGNYLSQGFVPVLKNAVDALSLAVVIVVCAVPEGLPLMISLVLMQNTSKMLDHNVLVRKAEGIETAGSLNILFSDKTGTITKGRLEVVEFFTAGGITIPLEELDQHTVTKSLLDLAIGKNSQSMFDGQGNVVGGNATDQALMKLIGAEVYAQLESGCAVTQSQSFNSSNKFSQAYLADLGKTFYKGAPERLLARAKRYVSLGGEVRDIDSEVVNRKIDELAARSMRVLALGYSQQEMVHDQINPDTVIIGFVAIRDDVRPEARQAIASVQRAGIQVVMITGDRLETAASIARDAGLLQKNDDLAITSAQLNRLSDDEVKRIVPRIRVIARALPTDKSRMVRLCQEMGLVVGMTGDGVNDSPALKRADVGFAMGSGTQAAKEAGKIVILDDNFKSIRDAIWYGRTIYHNILKFCKFQLTINFTAVVVSAIAPFFGVDEPLQVTHLLFVNLVMDGLGAMMLGSEPAQKAYMREKPRRRDESIVSCPMAAQIGAAGLWLTALSFFFLKAPCFNGLFQTTEQRLSAYFVLFIWSALFNGFNVRDEGGHIFRGLNENRGFLQVFAIIVAAQAVVVNAALLPGLGWLSRMFHCVPFSPAGWAVVVVLAVSVIPLDLIRKGILVLLHPRAQEPEEKI